MSHEFTLITTLAVGFGLALVLGFLAARVRLPPLVGYLLAGVLIGPATPGFVADLSLARQLAEVGVILLMFGVGLHFSLPDLMSVRNIALPGAIVQTLVATTMGIALASYWGWGFGTGLIFGLSLSVASTVVLLRALEDRGLMGTLNGNIAVGWLVVEDILMVLVLVLLPAIAVQLGGTALPDAHPTSNSILVELAMTLARVAAFVVVMLIFGRRLLPRALWAIAGTGSRELFTLAVIAVSLGIAVGAATLFGVSFALGAFFAGTVMRESALSHRAAQESLPLRDSFAVLFFVSVGMLLDPATLIEQPLRLLSVLAVILIGKSLAAATIVLAFRYPLNTALTVSASLAQIGEFSFILASLGVALGLLSTEGSSLILAAAIISIAINPMVFHAIEPVQRWIRGRSQWARQVELRHDPLAQLPVEVTPETVTDHVVLVGYGRVGRRISQSLSEAGITFVIVEQTREEVERLRLHKFLAVSGDASDPAVIIQAHIGRARALVITTPDAARAHVMMDVARRINPTIAIAVRTYSDAEAELFTRERADAVFVSEHELAHGMIAFVLDRIARASASDTLDDHGASATVNGRTP